MKAYFSYCSILTHVDLLVFFPASPRLWEWKTKDTEQKLWCHLTLIFGRNQVWEVMRLLLFYLISIWLRNENALFKSNPFGCWVKEPMFCRCEAPTDFSSFLKSFREQSLFQSFLPPAKIRDKCCGTIAVMYFFNGLQKKCTSCLDLLSSGQVL